MPKQLVRIVPPERGDGGAALAVGTRVLLPSGEAIPGVTNITLTAKPGDCWRATIEVVCQAPTQFAAVAEVRGKCRGPEPVDITSMESVAVESIAGLCPCRSR